MAFLHAGISALAHRRPWEPAYVSLIEVPELLTSWHGRGDPEVHFDLHFHSGLLGLRAVHLHSHDELSSIKAVDVLPLAGLLDVRSDLGSAGGTLIEVREIRYGISLLAIVDGSEGLRLEIHDDHASAGVDHHFLAFEVMFRRLFAARGRAARGLPSGLITEIGACHHPRS
jgi:hypothetical protein